MVATGNAGSSKIEDQLQSLGDNFVWVEAGSRARNGVRAGAPRHQVSGAQRRPCHPRASAFDQKRVLGIRIIAASSPQAKGRVERMHGVHQDRLVKKTWMWPFHVGSQPVDYSAGLS